MSKRRRFLIISSLLSLGFVAIQFLSDQNRFWAIGLLGVSTFLFFFWAMYETLGKNMTLLTLILPVLFTFGVGTFWFLLPTNIYVRIPIVIFYGIGIYVLCLTMNIFTVSAIRTIALLRAARGVGFVVSLLTTFLIYDAILSLKAELYLQLPLFFASSFLLFIQGFWSVVLEKNYQKELTTISIGCSLVIAELAGVLYFWPVTVVVGSLFLTVVFYILLGLGQAKLEEKLFQSIVREYLTVGLLVFLAVLISTHWGA